MYPRRKTNTPCYFSGKKDIYFSSIHQAICFFLVLCHSLKVSLSCLYTLMFSAFNLTREILKRLNVGEAYFILLRVALKLHHHQNTLDSWLAVTCRLQKNSSQIQRPCSLRITARKWPTAFWPGWASGTVQYTARVKGTLPSQKLELQAKCYRHVGKILICISLSASSMVH